jgi:AcrR family transcriptional regulator
MANRHSDDRDGEEADLRWLHPDALARTQEEAARAERAERSAATRRAMERAALELSGEVGYGQMTVAALIRRSDSNLDRFYKAYRSKFDCYLTGYEGAIDALCERLLGACAEAADWPAGMRAALGELAGFLSAEPSRAKGVLAEVYVAGGAALEKRNEVFERLSRAIDRARRETVGSRHSPPPITSRFILNAIEATVVRDLASGKADDFAAQLPGVLYLASTPYFGRAEASRAARRLS